MTTSSFDLDAAKKQLSAALADGKLTASAGDNIRKWLEEPRYAEYASDVAEHIRQGKWQALDDAFWTVIPFGTGGRRGRMYPIGSNAINDRTIGESAQGLAHYVRDHQAGPWSCAIAFDTRHRSLEFARLCAGVMVAAGFEVFFLDEIRSTPELSFLVRYMSCSCGIMVTASHNPPSDNAVKAYWSTGGQILPPHDKGVIDRVMNVQDIEVADFAASVAAEKIVLCKEEVDEAFLDAVQQQSFPGSRALKIIYSPLHGVGGTAAAPALRRDGFEDVEIFGPHATPDGDFPNVPGHVSNPENAAVFDTMIERARQIRADLILATDPDCDRVGCAAPLTIDSAADWGTFTGNQIAVLLGDFVFSRRRQAGTLSPDHYMVTTLVTTRMVGRIARAYGMQVYEDNLVGFKWIAGVMDDVGPDQFVLGTEESHGYLVGQHVRDKDAAVASMLLAELAAECKANEQTLHQKLDALYRQHGCHIERLATQKMEGSEGMALMKQLMARFRAQPPQHLAGIEVAAVRDYQANTITPMGGAAERLEGPTGDLVMIDLKEDGNCVAVRPSGTEPKVKFYMFAYQSADEIKNLADTKQLLQERLDALEADLAKFASLGR